MTRDPSVRLCIGLPVYGGYTAEFFKSFLALTLNPPCHLHPAPVVGDSLVARARNRIAAAFLASPCTHLLFLDTDLIFSPEHIERLISHRLPIVAGLYPKKQVELDWVVNTLPGHDEWDENGLRPVRYIGTGCLLIAREVLEAIAAKYPELRYDADDGEDASVVYHDFFRCGVREDPETGRRRYLSEDWWFCQMARDAGYEVMADSRVLLKHVGSAVYPLQDLPEEVELDEDEDSSTTPHEDDVQSNYETRNLVL